MPDQTPPGSLPPEVPEEFAAAYRAAYERALAAQSEGRQQDAEWEEEPGVGDDLPERRGRLVVGTHRTESYDGEPTAVEKLTDSPWFVPLLLTLLALLLILGAYAVGRSFAGKVNDDADSSSDPGVVLSERGAGDARQPVSTQAPGEGAWDGKVKPVRDVKAKASCTSPPGLDAAGEEISYAAANLTDGVADTTWRCDGTAVGEKIRLKLPDDVAIGEVGLIPGYAKTDEASGADRYAENNRVKRVRWTIGDTVVVQKMKAKPSDRSLRLLRVPRTETDKVVLEILAVKEGPRNTTAISEIQLGRAGYDQVQLTRGVEDHRDGSVVGQLHRHLGAEDPFLDVGPGLRQAGAHRLVERFGHLAGCRRLPGRPTTLARVAVQRELADHQHRRTRGPRPTSPRA